MVKFKQTILKVNLHHCEFNFICLEREFEKTKLPATPTSIANARKRLSNDNKLAIIGIISDAIKRNLRETLIILAATMRMRMTTYSDFTIRKGFIQYSTIDDCNYQ